VDSVIEVKSKAKSGVGCFAENRVDLINRIPGLPGPEIHGILTTSHFAEPMETDHGGMEPMPHLWSGQSTYPARLESQPCLDIRR
jgi:hypothetical protein